MKVNGQPLIADTVEYVQAQSNYSLITLIDGRQVLSSHNLDRITTFLGLMRVNRSITVNRNYIKEIDPQGKVLMRSGFAVNVSRRRRMQSLI